MQVIGVRMGTSNAYLVRDPRGCVLVDAGNANRENLLWRALKKHGLGPAIKLVVITHVHFDHVGSLQAIKEVCRCPVAVHRAESEMLRRGTMVLPPGTNLFTFTILRQAM